MSGVLRLLIGNLLVFAILLGVLEGIGQVVLLFAPSDEVIFLEPDPIVGWKQVPNLRWTWGGAGWYASEFSVPIETNSHGFRDLPRSHATPEGVVRVALLGDSYVEAIQVPLEQTAGQRLEQILNEGDGPGEPVSPRWEVLNFGISNYSIGQYLLLWEEYVKHFEPDYVFALVTDLTVMRTVVRREPGAFQATDQLSLRVRPTFQLVDDGLVREPAPDSAQFARVQEELIRTEFGGDRSRRRTGSVVWYFLSGWWALATPSDEPSPEGQIEWRSLLALNLRILEELGAQVRASGAVLAVVDTFRYHSPRYAGSSKALKQFSREHGFGYVDLSDPLLRSNRSGSPIHWVRDRHFNEKGNEIFAASLRRWLKEHAEDR